MLASSVMLYTCNTYTIVPKLFGNFIKKPSVWKASSRAMSKFTDDPEIYAIDVMKEHPRVTETCLKHVYCAGTYEEKNILSDHTVEAFEEARSFVKSFYEERASTSEKFMEVIFDSGCGTGTSSLKIAKQNPDLPIIGIDRSLHRLSKQDRNYLPSNLLLLRADLIDFWLQSFREHDWIVKKHFILYPNPYPKAKHHRRRFPGHPIFPFIVCLGGELVLRSNWNIYLEEFQTALNSIASLPSASLLKGCCAAQTLPFKVNPTDGPLTNFERKYSAVDLPLYELRVQMGLHRINEREQLISSLIKEAGIALKSQG